MSQSQPPRFKAAILVVSTTAACKQSRDTTGLDLKDLLQGQGSAGQWNVVETRIVGDNVLDIQQSICRWSDENHGSDSINLVLTAGGTGFATSDVTPEVSLAMRINLIIMLIQLN